ncbi:MAG: PQQ-dependent sugar dehydrogenase [Sumerlaeia bacterium]
MPKRLLLALFLLTCACSSSAQQSKTPRPDTSGIDGAALYQRYCAGCHGSEHQGASASSLADNTWKYGAAAADFFRNTKRGIIQEGMPAFGGGLSDAEIWAIAEYVEQVEPAREAPPETRQLDNLRTLDYVVGVEVWVDGVDQPWGMTFVSPTRALFTEKAGRLRVVENGRLLREPVADTPRVDSGGQGGLLDVAVDASHHENGWVYLAYSHAAGSRAMTRIVRGKIADNRWTGEEVLWEARGDHYVRGGRHFGSRIVFGPDDGMLYFAVGDRGQRHDAQRLDRPNGKIHRIAPDGSIPPDNPFVGQDDVYESIWSYGHRNPQGLDFHPATGDLWSVEHGPRGGDELNKIEKAVNYGWPVITYGIEYSGGLITSVREKEGYAQPNWYWRPSPAPCGMAFYSGELFPYWKGRAMVAQLRDEDVRLMDIYEDRVLHEEILLDGLARTRDVQIGPGGEIYVLQEQPGRILRLVPIREEPI